MLNGRQGWLLVAGCEVQFSSSTFTDAVIFGSTVRLLVDIMEEYT